jgi:hypothetical protein
MSRALNALLNDRKTVDALVDLYERTLRQLVDELSYGVSRPGAARVSALLKRIDEILVKVDPKKSSPIRSWLRNQAPRAYVLGDKESTQRLRNYIKNLSSEKRDLYGEPKTAWTSINNSTMNAIVRSLGETFSKMKADMKAAVGVSIRRTQLTLLQSEKVAEATSGGIIRGRTGQEVADDIASILLKGKVSPEVRKRLSAIGFRGDMFNSFEKIARGEMITVGKKTMSVRAYADLVSQTQMREMHKVATVTRAKQNDIDHVRISNHPMKVPDECTPFAGKVYYVGPLSKDPLGFPRLDSILNGGPPFHPRCKHSAVEYPIFFQTDKKVEKEKAEALKTPSKFYGKSASEVRRLVNESTTRELDDINAEAMKLTG